MKKPKQETRTVEIPVYRDETGRPSCGITNKLHACHLFERCFRKRLRVGMRCPSAKCPVWKKEWRTGGVK